jgi:uncharacterized protein (DUF1501 family)
MRLSKRRFLEILGVTGSVVALRSLGSVATARADEDDPQLLLMVQFEGAWDQLLALDPRNNNAYTDNTGNKIFPAYDLVTDPAVGAVLDATGGTGIQTRGNLGFGPAVASSLLDHAADLAIVRGIMMDTLTHEVGRRYFSTGKFPRGLTPNGSSLTTMAVALQDSTMTLPNLAIDFDAYNEGQPAYASAIHARSAEDVHKVLSPLGVPLEASSDAALEQLEGADPSCLQNELDGGGMVGLFRDSRAKARSIITSGKAALFDLQLGAGSPQEALLTALGISTQADLEGPKGKAALAALALENAVSQAVGVRLVQNLDDHTDWADNQATTQLAGWDALGRLIAYLKQAAFKGTGGGTIWSRTTLLVCSDFARGPRLNDRGGRDHHLASSCLVAGPGIAGNSLVGATSDNDMGVRKVNLDTGVADDDSGQVIRPADVHATLLASMGLPYDHLSNTSPQVIGKLLKA